MDKNIKTQLMLNLIPLVFIAGTVISTFRENGQYFYSYIFLGLAFIAMSIGQTYSYKLNKHKKHIIFASLQFIIGLAIIIVTLFR